MADEPKPQGVDMADEPKPPNEPIDPVYVTGGANVNFARYRMTVDYDRGCMHIGHFLFQFSQLEFTIRVMLTKRLGLSDELFDIVTAPYDFGALCSVAEKIATKLNPNDADEIHNTYSECRALSDHRNRVAHGLWTHGDNDTVTVRAVSRHKLASKFWYENDWELRKLAEDANKLMQRVLGLKPSTQNSIVPEQPDGT